MLNMYNIKSQYHSLTDGTTVEYVEVPKMSYNKLKKDFKAGTHFKAIDNLDLTTVDGVIIKCAYENDGLMAAIYAMKKYEAIHNQEVEDTYDEEYYEEFNEFDEDDYPEDVYDEHLELSHLIQDDNRVKRIPIIESYEFGTAFRKQGSEGMGMNNYQSLNQLQGQSERPYWFNENYPLIVVDRMGSMYGIPVEELKKTNRLIFLIMVKDGEMEEGGDLNLSINGQEEKLLFEKDYELLKVTKCNSSYYQKVLTQAANDYQGYKISGAVDKKKVIEDLINYRKTNFSSNRDIVNLIQKAIKKKKGNSKTINNKDFERVILLKETQGGVPPTSNSTKELDKLVGLEDVKDTLRRIINRMKFDKERRTLGYKTSDSHMAAVFMGNPGTAKTTVARIFGKMLCEEGVLSSYQFLELSRKDFIGKYVGWTAPQVAQIFEVGKGGTIFIDEAYSLLGEETDSFSQEALAEIIRQMENNPDTLVIFAGYQDEMKKFVKEANPGLRSRLTNIVEFNDYDTEEMFKILSLLLRNEQFKLQDHNFVKDQVDLLVTELRHLSSRNIGNGRLMRKLFKIAVGHMADRKDNDYTTLQNQDIKMAVQEILTAEKNISSVRSNDKRKVGFVH